MGSGGEWKVIHLLLPCCCPLLFCPGRRQTSEQRRCHVCPVRRDLNNLGKYGMICSIQAEPENRSVRAQDFL